MSELPQAQLKSWLNPRKKRFWGLIAVFTYTVVGFFIVPLVIKQQLPKLAPDLIQRDASIGEVKFNPWTLRLEANDLLVLEDDSSDFASAGGIVANLQLSSVFHRALKFREITLTKPIINLTRYRSGETNIGKLAADLTPPENTNAEPGGLIRLIVDKLAIEQGNITVTDNVSEPAFDTQITPIDIAIDNLSTLPDDAGNQTISITLDGASQIDLQGSVQLNPLLITSRIDLQGSPLSLLQRYLDRMLAFTVADEGFTAGLDLRIEQRDDASIAAQINNIQISQTGLAATTKQDGQEILAVNSLNVTGGELAWPEQRVRVAEIVISKPNISVSRDGTGQLNIANLVVAESPNTIDEPNTAEQSAEDSSTAWQLLLSRFAINGLGATFTDAALETPGKVGIANLDLTLRDFANSADQPAQISLAGNIASGGSFKLDGSLAIVPTLELAANIDVSGVTLAGAQPWISDVANIAIDSGAANLVGAISINDGEPFAYEGSGSLDNLKISDSVENLDLAGLRSLQLDQARLALSRGELEISTLNIDQPSGRFVIAKDGTTNFSALTKQSADPAENTSVNESASDNNPFIVKIGKTNVSNGMVDFADFSLPLPFSALITEFGGTISALATNSSQPSVLDFDGKVGEYGLATVDGSMNLTAPTNQADVKLNFRNVSMPELSPYTVEFAGQKIGIRQTRSRS